jgi:hypothetical protein
MGNVRAQTSLPALGIALVLLVSTTVFAVAVAEERLASSRDETLERESAAGLADSLVAADATVTRRANVVDPGALGTLDAAQLEGAHGLESTAGVQIRLDGQSVLSRGATEAGSTIERIVLVERRAARTIVPRFNATRVLTLPRRTPNATVTVATRDNATVTGILVDGRVVRRNPGGLAGSHVVQTSRYRTATLEFAGRGNLSRGDVSVTYYPARSRKATLSVTVQRWGDAGG